MEQALEEADRLLGEEFQKPTNEILKVIPRGGERRTYLFSAIMTNKVKKVARAGLRNPVKLEVASKYSTVDTLKQHMMTVPVQYKKCQCTAIVFTEKCSKTPFLACMLQNLGIKAIALRGQMSQSERIEALTMFKAGQCNVLVCTNLASRGLDIPSLDMVINYNVPASPKQSL
uniref:DEAD-box ATP-dependent RNA helicase 10-like isoform X2 n=1 Tax=Fragaria vesca subsp. vesca TaxID=101020 RepID=UPI0005CA7668|nr:PREDICTED: DEAD-box ATP-dependent RNA helicase 10-like isoform X2 [Fragaria vesca subsp. vesca]XP_011467934.1 PREDICTED: DEAD-box ATP-dependent RNA helicase 10-like isoform X2 [Fragaria vesca subsp. vesca]